jgi:H2-forming N5,N10-methylenetetrahydromethanopterin dehydrogenase-like enzyme
MSMDMPMGGEAPAAEPSEGEGAKSVVDAAKAALDVALSDPDFASSFESTSTLTLSFADNGDIDVETDDAKTTVLAGELGAGDTDDSAAPQPPMPPMAA